MSVRRRVLHLRSSGGLLGAEQVVLTLCRDSSAHGYEAMLAVTRDRKDPLPDLFSAATASGIRSHVIECRDKYDFGALGQLRRLVDEHKIDVLHCHGYREDFYAVAAGVRARKVTTNHLWKRTTRALRFYARMDSWLLRRFDRVATVSLEIFRELESTGLRAPRLAYIPNGVDTTRYAPRDETSVARARETLAGAARSDILLTTVGSLTEEKGHECLLRALATLGGSARVKLLVAGDGPLREKLRASAVELGISDLVRFLGRRDDVPDILACTDIFVLPSLREGLPIALLEAMASERACVAADVGDVGRAIETGVTGVLVGKGDVRGFGNALEQLAATPALRARLGTAARRRVIERFSAESMTKSYCALYDDLLAGA